jgi:hypothetical protein
MPEICPGMAKTDKINAKACLNSGSPQPGREFHMKLYKALHFSAAC